MEENNKQRRPLWFRMLVLLSVLPIVLWLYAYQIVSGRIEGVEAFVLTWFPAYVFAMLAMAYFTRPDRREISNVLMWLVWLSYAALASYIWAL
ncbi:MAG: hypothetical protein ACI4AH_00655 [Muribaculaceae bacterium]